MDYKCTVEIKGNIFDSLNLVQILDEITETGCTCDIREIKMGESITEDSYARLKIRSRDKKQLDELIKKIKKHGAVPVKTSSKIVELQGHILDSLTLSKILDIIFNSEARCEVLDLKIGIEKKDFSSARIKIITTDKKILSDILGKIAKHGAVTVEK